MAYSSFNFQKNEPKINFTALKNICYLELRLSEYDIKMINIYPLLPLYVQIFRGVYKLGKEKILGWFQKINLEPGEWKNQNAHTPMTLDLAAKIHADNPPKDEEILKTYKFILLILFIE